MASLLILGMAVALGLWLAGQYIYAARPGSRLRAAGCVHGGFGAAGLAILAVALRAGPSAHAVRLGVGGFGRVALAVLALVLCIGVAIAGLRLARRAVPVAVVAVHAVLAIAGAVLLVAYAGLQT